MSTSTTRPARVILSEDEWLLAELNWNLDRSVDWFEEPYVERDPDYEITWDVIIDAAGEPQNTYENYVSVITDDLKQKYGYVS